MIPARLSANTDRNAPLKDPFPRLTADETNDAWLQRVLAGPLKDRRGPFVLLVGGAALSHFRVRVAQSHARIDLLPSYWSHCALVQRDAGPGQRHVVRHVPFDLRGDIDDMPARNGVERADITAFADPTRYPNLALLAFGVVEPEVEETAVKSLRGGRLTEDLVSPLVPWLAYIWGAGPNPLLAGTPLPAALYVSALFASAHVDLTPGLSERVACPDPACGFVQWGNPTPAVGALVEHEGEIVLARGQGWPEGWFALVTGYLEAREDPKAAVVREVREELGLEVVETHLIGNYLFEKKNEIMLCYHAIAEGTVRLGEEIAEVRRHRPEALRPWPRATGFAVADWLRSRGLPAQFADFPAPPRREPQ